MPEKWPKADNESNESIIIDDNESGVSKQPDEYTAKDPTFVEGGAPNQIFRFQKFGLQYGTDDKGHAAAIILAVLLLIILLCVFGIGAFVDRAWVTDAIKILGTSFSFVAGVAIGKSANGQ